jgi:hypothetical protein
MQRKELKFTKTIIQGHKLQKYRNNTHKSIMLIFSKQSFRECFNEKDYEEMQIKSTLRFYLIPVRRAIIKNTTTNMC